jgi:hypothetical protein
MMQYRTPHTFQLALLLFAVLLCTGCRSKDLEIKGKVTLAGKPINLGTISFQPAEGHGPTAAEKVADGQFSVRIMPGKYNVQITGFRKVGQQHANVSDPNSPMKDILEPIVPNRYNTASTLTREIKPGEQQVDFLLD